MQKKSHQFRPELQGFEAKMVEMNTKHILEVLK